MSRLVQRCARILIKLIDFDFQDKKKKQTDRGTGPNLAHSTTSAPCQHPTNNTMARRTKSGTGESTPAETLYPSVVYESPNAKKNRVVPHVRFAPHAAVASHAN